MEIFQNLFLITLVICGIAISVSITLGMVFTIYDLIKAIMED